MYAMSHKYIITTMNKNHGIKTFFKKHVRVTRAFY
jgi:acetylglutamate kinase